jgi:hypothetical protein
MGNVTRTIRCVAKYQKNRLNILRWVEDT